MKDWLFIERVKQIVKMWNLTNKSDSDKAMKAIERTLTKHQQKRFETPVTNKEKLK